jgi:hypothetical protein
MRLVVSPIVNCRPVGAPYRQMHQRWEGRVGRKGGRFDDDVAVVGIDLDRAPVGLFDVLHTGESGPRGLAPSLPGVALVFLPHRGYSFMYKLRPGGSMTTWAYSNVLIDWNGESLARGGALPSLRKW